MNYIFVVRMENVSYDSGLSVGHQGKFGALKVCDLKFRFSILES